MAESSGPENLGDVLARLFTARGWGRKSERLRLEAAWAEAVGPAFLPETRVSGLRRGVMEVEVKSGVLIQELAQFHKRKLITALREKLPGTTITDLKFRAGAW
ncbi:DUF721 domain-containing protein [Fimbriiglobus ruber]|uniref:DUF721 domain-containing protein n=1 Tax=Fimbriiglobus ruber TaxID=1908690 RepID=A0A225EAG4_9BACT|nr:DUF721 domain-containing protein [Fimbriiglobus ruber]OWK45397.1 hypothetical protein FRUB_01728 [Fimbriiglobus ruber]